MKKPLHRLKSYFQVEICQKFSSLKITGHEVIALSTYYVYENATFSCNEP